MIMDYIPKFLTNEKYAIYDTVKGVFILTEEGKKDKEVVESFEEFYKELDKTNE